MQRDVKKQAEQEEKIKKKTNKLMNLQMKNK
jgi:hypothetical protein